MSYLFIVLEQRRKDLEHKEEMRHAQILEKELVATPPSPSTEGVHSIEFILKGREPNEKQTASMSTGSIDDIHSHSTS
ncbi:hypothetical protein PRIPAC_82687 [Pristionchus pacificus]|uniref:Uncharacterized protein n=1 Tax=Pristionchus pacificus TaxID=54126 RepID=A0A2A6C1J6_PRIPA|nr:hypothetical protein PRIPAC_82687 [Pristionchus pacificus]|eukprot:PDM72122.1 hypothetical protein PRIPAC_38556 [Pristionchus pacificus]